MVYWELLRLSLPYVVTAGCYSLLLEVSWPVPLEFLLLLHWLEPFQVEMEDRRVEAWCPRAHVAAPSVGVKVCLLLSTWFYDN